jgi:ppGpp synthetase/RelA/SpoT-type nucleotidyltranferase
MGQNLPMTDQARGGGWNILGDAKLLLGKKNAEDYHEEYRQKRKDIWNRALKALVKKVSARLKPLERQGYKFLKPYGRVKAFDSLIRSAFAEFSKTGAKGTFDWDFILREVDDIVGLRVVTLNLGDIAPVVRMVLSDESFSWSRDRIKDFYKKGSKSGYRSWQIKMKWRSALADTPLRIEIQVRTILEDAWSEWEHNLFYKPPEGMLPSSWQELKILHAEQAEAISDSLYEAAQATERLRATFEIIKHRPPEHVSTFLDRAVP